MAIVKTPARRAKHVKLVQIVYYYCWLASSDNLFQCMYNYVFGKYIFCLVAPLTHRSNSKAIHKFSKFITGISFYYIQQVINPHRQRGYIINTKVFITQQITSNEMNFQLNQSSALEMLALNHKWFSAMGHLLSISRPTQDWSSRLKRPTISLPG